MKFAKFTASFSGEPMRSNLFAQLDHWGVPQWLSVDFAASLFREHRNLIQTTSLLRFPTFVSDKVYAGAPDMIRNAFLMGFLYEHFVEEVRLLPDALFFGLGPKVQSVLARLADEGAIRPEQVITGLLHPSGNNTYRIDYLIGDRRGPLPHATDPKTYDAGRELFREQLRQ